MKPPKTRTCTIGEMLAWASAANGKTKQKRAQVIIKFALANVTLLNQASNLPWSRHKRVIRAIENIHRVGITDSLELTNHDQLSRRFASGIINEMKEVATILGLHLNKVNGLLFVTRQPLTIKPAEARSLEEMPPPSARNVES